MYVFVAIQTYRPLVQNLNFRVGYNIKKNLKEDMMYKDRDSQIKAIETTFDFAKKQVFIIQITNAIQLYYI